MSSAEPDLRARVTQAIRDEAETHSCLYQEGINVDEMAHRVLAAIGEELAAGSAGPATCDATELMESGSFFGNPATFGPCVLRAGHDGPGHKGANGAQWWPRNVAAGAGPAETIARLRQQLDAVRDVVEDMKATTGARWWAQHLAPALGGEQPPPVTVNPVITELTAKRMVVLAPACPSRRHVDHPGYDCDEQDAAAEAWDKTWGKWLGWVGGDVRSGEVGPALRGPNYPHAAPEPDPGPLRAIAEQALGVREPGTVYRDPRADDPGYDPITGYRTWAEVEADPPQPTGVLAMFQNPQENQ